MSDFDNWFKKKFRDLHDAILCGDLVAGNYKKVSKKSYEAGQQSKQAEVDELRKRIDKALDEIDTLRAEKTELFRIATERGELLSVLKNYKSNGDFVFRINTNDTKHAALVYKTLLEKKYTEQIKVSKFSEGDHGVFLVNCGYFYFRKYPFSSPDYWWKAVRNLDSLPVWIGGSYEIFKILKGDQS